MAKCMICNDDLYKNISYNNLFRMNYTVHDSCINNLIINTDRIAFPVEGNIIYYDYLFYDLNSNYNIEYLEEKYLRKLYIRNLENRDWSIIIFYKEGLFADFSYDDIQILFSLVNVPVLIISVIYYDMSKIFNENI